MVKNLITAAIALLIIATLCGLEAYTQETSFGKMHAASIAVYEKALDKTATEEDGKALKSLWQAKKKKLHVFIPHADIREMDLWISEAVYYLGEEDFAEACGKLKVIVHYLENIPETYDFSLENFL